MRTTFTFLTVLFLSGCSVTSGFDDYTFKDPDAGTDTGMAGMGGSDAYVMAGAGGKPPRDAEPEDTSVPDAEVPDTGPPELLSWCERCDQENDLCGEGLGCKRMRVTWVCQTLCECEYEDNSRCGIPCTTPGDVCLGLLGRYYYNEQNVRIERGVCAPAEFVAPPSSTPYKNPQLDQPKMEATCLSM